MVVDVCTFNGEHDLWDIHYNVLKDYVDEFIVVEFDKTFSGVDKPFYGDGLIQKYMVGKPFIKYCKYNEDFYGKYAALAESSPNTQGAAHWKREFMQKESIKDALTHLNDDDIVFVGDVDEVWDPEHITYLTTTHDVEKMKLAVYTYYLNNRSNERFWGTIYGRYGDIKDTCLNHIRTNATQTAGTYGWHFTSMAHQLRQKLTDSYTQESYATDEVLNNLAYNVENMRDFLGRDFNYKLDESEWPQYLKDNRSKYEHLCKSTAS